MVAVEWETLTTFGAFVVGMAVGVVITIRLLRVALDVIRRERSKD